MTGKTPRSWVLHKIAYIMLATIYASASAGFDQTVFYVLVAAMYVLLATE